MNKNSLGQPIHEIEAFYVLDLDRCLVDTDRLHKLLEEMVGRETPVTTGTLSAARAMVEQAGETFDTIEYVRRTLGNDFMTTKWVSLQERFIEKAKMQDMLLPHAKEMLEILAKQRLYHGIITYGVEPWQLAKLEACGLAHIPHVVTHIKEKGKLLTGWKHGRDSFVIPPALHSDPTILVSRNLVFLDDKAISFQGLPSGVQGLQVVPANTPLLAAQAGALPPNVALLHGMNKAIELLFGDEVVDKT